MKEKKNVFQIDRQNLDEELAGHPHNFHKAAVRYARAVSACLAAKNALEVIEAEVSLSVRKAPQKFGLDKVTDKGVETVVTLHLDYRESLKAYMKAQEEEAMSKAAVDALNHKGHSLRGLVYLTGAEYTQPNEDVRGRTVNRRNGR